MAVSAALAVMLLALLSCCGTKCREGIRIVQWRRSWCFLHLVTASRTRLRPFTAISAHAPEAWWCSHATAKVACRSRKCGQRLRRARLQGWEAVVVL